LIFFQRIHDGVFYCFDFKKTAMPSLTNAEFIEAQIFVLDANNELSPVFAADQIMALKIDISFMPRTSLDLKKIIRIAESGIKKYFGEKAFQYARKIELAEIFSLPGGKNKVNKARIHLVVPSKNTVEEMFDRSINIGVSSLTIRLSGQEFALQTTLSYGAATNLIFQESLEEKANNSTTNRILEKVSDLATSESSGPLRELFKTVTSPQSLPQSLTQSLPGF